MENLIWLIAIGLAVGGFGTLIGAGGGFILMPIFFLLYPEAPPEQLTAISLTVVFFNALSGTVAYARKGRIDYRSGIIFSIATVPGAILGALSTSMFSRATFDPIFSAALIAVSVYLLLRPSKMEVAPQGGHTYSMPLGVGLSAGVGYCSSVLGIGGGIIHVPAMVQLLHFPVHIATATSHFILAIMTFIGATVHLINGDLKPGFTQVLFLAPSVIIGAQVGARLSHRVHGSWIIRALALALAFVGLRLLIGSL